MKERENEYYRFCTDRNYNETQNHDRPSISDAIEWADNHPSEETIDNIIKLFYEANRKIRSDLKDMPDMPSIDVLQNMQKAYIMKREYIVDNYENANNVCPSVETLLKIFYIFDKCGLIKDNLCFDPEHFMEHRVKYHWCDYNDNGEIKTSIDNE